MEKVGQANAFHCVASTLLLIIVCKCLGTAEIPCWTFGKENVIRCKILAAQLVRLCHVFSFIMWQMFTAGNWWSGLQAGQFNPRTFLLWSHAVYAECGLTLSCWKMPSLPSKRRLDGSICWSKTCIYFQALTNKSFIFLFMFFIKKSYFEYSHVCNMLAVKLIGCSVPPAVCFYCHLLFQLFEPTFLRYVTAIKLKMTRLIYLNDQFSQFKHMIWIRYRFMKFGNHRILFLFNWVVGSFDLHQIHLQKKGK